MLTGKDIHAAFKQHDNHAKEWEEVSEYGRAAYEAVAEKLSEAHIAPLQGLVRDFTDLIDGDDLDLERIGEKRDALFARVHILCREEPKS